MSPFLNKMKSAREFARFSQTPLRSRKARGNIVDLCCVMYTCRYILTEFYTKEHPKWKKRS